MSSVPGEPGSANSLPMMGRSEDQGVPQGGGAAAGTRAGAAIGSAGSLNLDTVLGFLRSQGLSGTENLLMQELGTRSKEVEARNGQQSSQGAQGSEVGNVLSSYNSEGDPSIHAEAYKDLQRFVESSLDLYRHELALILYPVFVHMYLELVYNGHEVEARHYIETFGPQQEPFYQQDIQKLSYITKREHMKGSELMENFRTSQFTVRMSRDTYTQLRHQKKFMSEKKHSVLWNIIQEHLYLDVYEGIARNKQQIVATAGGMIGEANRQANRTKVFYGLPREPDLTGFGLLDPEEDEEDDKAAGGKKKKIRRDLAQLRKQKNDPNAPSTSRIPFPDLRDVDKAEKAKSLREIFRRQNLSTDTLPSIIFYTVLNACSSPSAVEICDDSSILALGFTNSIIKIWSLNPHKLKGLKSSELLNEINRDSDDVLIRMLDESSGEMHKTLHGHSGPVYGLSFSPDRTLLLSCSEDGTIRLWSLQTWTCLVNFKGHVFPVWQVKFSNQGYYFVSSGHDKTIRLWSTEQSQCIRVFVGHFSDVDCLSFHPNSNYVASGSSDRSVRMWDCATGHCVRLMTGHKSSVSTLAFSYDGRFLASGGCDNHVLLWDVAHGHLLGDFEHHKGMITSLVFSRCSNVLASASVEGNITLWNYAKFVSDCNLEEVNVTHNPSVRTDSGNLIIASFRTKESSVVGIHFTRRNLLIGVGNSES